MLKNLEDLKNHLNKYKDALIIIGPGINPYIFNKDDNFKENYNKKSIRRNYVDTIKYYKNNLNVEINNCEAYDIIKTIPHGLIVDQNINGSIPANYIHGHVNVLRCQKCRTVYSKASMDFNKEKLECEVCNGGLIRPTVLLDGENYDPLLIKEFEDALSTTHTLILVGADLSEAYFDQKIIDFGADKAFFNSDNYNGNSSEEKVLVAIEAKDSAVDTQDLVKCEFFVKDDVTEALIRLRKGLK